MRLLREILSRQQQRSSRGKACLPCMHIRCAERIRAQEVTKSAAGVRACSRGFMLRHSRRSVRLSHVLYMLSLVQAFWLAPIRRDYRCDCAQDE
ncbi:hypothetical protein KCU59_g46, partial [Aureobasidium melanogenum]